MFVKTDNPLLVILRERVERKFGRKLEVPFDFTDFRESLFASVGEQLSESTLQRIWQYVGGYERISSKTLDILARYVGYESWSVFEIKVLLETQEDSEFFDDDLVLSISLPVESKLLICWDPNRRCIIEYKGNCRFEVVEVQNSKLCKGDTFLCERFRLNWPLFIYDLHMGGRVYSNYVMGRERGLTFMELLKFQGMGK